ncbi:MAG TPA: hypothetical protein VIH24_06435 [Candidatus Limnocylindria bacterium]
MRIAQVTALAAMVLGGVVACGVTAPPSGSPSADPVIVPIPDSTGAASAVPSAGPDDVTLLELADEMEVASISAEFSAGVLEHASTGSAVLLSAGLDEPEAAPDLYRVLPASGQPELIWRNPHRDHSLVNIGGEFNRVAFVDMPITGEIAWNLWFIPDEGADPILLDRHPGDPAVPTYVPSFSVYYPTIAWTAFDIGPLGPVSQLLYAQWPTWEPRLIAESPAAEAEFWFPSVLGFSVVYSKLIYSEDGSSDERHVYRVQLGADGPLPPMRLDASGMATMPLMNQYGILWKEADPGFNMLNWGRMFTWDPESETADLLDTSPQEYVNFPSIGERFAAWWGEDATAFSVYDLERDAVRGILRYPADRQQLVLRPHIAGSLLVWLYVDHRASPEISEIRYSWMPSAGGDRMDPP